MQGDPERAGVRRFARRRDRQGPCASGLPLRHLYLHRPRALRRRPAIEKVEDLAPTPDRPLVPGAVVAPVAAVLGDAGWRVLRRQRRTLGPDVAHSSPAERGPGYRAGHGSGDLRRRPDLVFDRSLGVRRFRRLERSQEPDRQRVDRRPDRDNCLHTDLHRAWRHGGPDGDRKRDASDRRCSGPLGLAMGLSRERQLWRVGHAHLEFQ